MHSLYRIINSTFERKEFLFKFARFLGKVMGSNRVTIVLLDQTKRLCICRVHIAPDRISVVERKTHISNPIEKLLIKRSDIIRQGHYIGVPLIADEILGFFAIKKPDYAFSLFDQEVLMTLSGQAVIAIKNFELINTQQKIITGAIKSILTLLGSHSPQAYAHTDYLSRIVDELAIRFHLSNEVRLGLKYASLLHDTGKADLPLPILLKPSELTGEELQLIKQHPAKSVQMLRHLKILKPAMPIILHHHERYDGAGYPSHLKGNQIPIGARILAVADAFDAMVFGRPYRNKVTPETALEELRKNAGTQFDPRVVEEFIRVVSMQKIKKLLKRI